MTACISNYFPYVAPTNEAKLSDNAKELLRQRYLSKDSQTGEVIESFNEAVSRIVNALKLDNEEDYQPRLRAIKEVLRDTCDDLNLKDLLYELIQKRILVPSTPVWVNAGKNKHAGLFACFALEPEDDLESILDTAKQAALIHKQAGGVGFNFSKIRAKGSIVGTTGGVASGPVSLGLKIVDAVTGEVKAGGVRRGANMGLLASSHPDAIDFIKCKTVEGKISNFNISLATDSKFMSNVERMLSGDPSAGLLQANERSTVRELWEALVKGAWRNGEPGVVFFDNANKNNLHISDEDLASDNWEADDYLKITNPCSEQILPNHGCCVLASIDVAKLVQADGTFDWDGYALATAAGGIFLDRLIDINEYVLDEIREREEGERRIGLGIMGFADLLVKQGIRFGSDESYSLLQDITKALAGVALATSMELGKELGSYPRAKEYKKELKERLLSRHPYLSRVPRNRWLPYLKQAFRDDQEVYLRNVTQTSIAPTGSIAILAETSHAIEPVFEYIFLQRNRLGQTRIAYHDALVREMDEEVRERFLTELADIHTSAKSLEEQEAEMFLSSKLQELRQRYLNGNTNALYVKATDLSLDQHLRIVSTAQQYIDSSISKTANAPAETTEKDVSRFFLEAWKSGIKSITLYRSGSRQNEVISAHGPSSGAATRPAVLYGATYKRVARLEGTTPENLYITVNSYGDEPYEVFISGTYRINNPHLAVTMDVVTRFVSLCLRHGVPREEIIKQLDRIRYADMYSVVTKISEVLSLYSNSIDSSGNIQSTRKCPECEAMLTYRDMCWTCVSCGWKGCSG